MIGLLCFVLAVLASPFKSKGRLEAENAVLRHQLIVLRRRVRGRTQPTNNDRWFGNAGETRALSLILQNAMDAWMTYPGQRLRPMTEPEPVSSSGPVRRSVLRIGRH
jgi:hypothetical protein